MKITSTQLVLLAAAAALGVSSLSLRSAFADEPTTAPSAAPTTAPAKTLAELNGEFRSLRQAIGKEISNPGVFTDPKLRAAAAEKALPLFSQLEVVANQIIALKPEVAPQLKGMHDQSVEYRAALDDKEAVAAIDAMTRDADASTKLKGQTLQLEVRWIQVADEDVAGQTKIVDDAEPIAKAHPESEQLTAALAGWAEATPSTELSDRILNVAGAMKNDAVEMVGQVKEQVAAAHKMKEMEGKAFALKGTTAEGKPFNSEDYKGKVVLVDFWATWCGPCVAGLPEVKETYAKFHDMGMEIIGVSNDYDVNALTSFTKKENIPWVQLYDSAAGPQHQWNPITLGYGINGIPHMFVIGRDGKLISANARATFPKLIETAVKTQG